MALNATIYKAELHVADTDRGYYDSHQLTLARHPSETAERLMLRLLVYALHVSGQGRLAFTRGLGDTEQPDLWQKDLTDAIELWFELGLPDERRVLKACGKADEVWVYAYGRTQTQWWQKVGARLGRAANLHVRAIAAHESAQLAELAGRNMVLHINIQEGSIDVHSDAGSVTLTPQSLQR